jgi:hypothetical protein
VNDLAFILICLAVIIGYFPFKNRVFSPFIGKSPRRRFIWNRIKWSIYFVLSVLLLFATFERWYYFRDEIACSSRSLEVNLSYADQIEVEAYLTTKEKLADVFEGKIVKENLLKNKKGSICYKVIRVKNKGSLPIYGILKDTGPERLRDVNVPPLPPHMDEFKSIIVWEPVYTEDRLYQNIELNFRWEKIYQFKRA